VTLTKPPEPMKPVESMGLRYDGQKLWFLDQTLLPHREEWLVAEHPSVMIEAIKMLRVRGAPLIGVAAAMSLGDFEQRGASRAELVEAGRQLASARPTAINLMHAVDRCLAARSAAEEAQAIFAEDVALCQRIGRHGAGLINDGSNVMTICNAGAIATVGIGTALGVFAAAKAQGKKFHVFVPETRPLLQGARLTTWELDRLGIPFTLICDNMMGIVLSRKKIQTVVVGADRIAKNGDFANKIGTYGLAVMARYHGVPFYVAAPHTTVDHKTLRGEDIPVETRHAGEVIGTAGLAAAEVYNPAFDVTPADLVTGWILDSGLKTKNDFLE